MLNLHKTLAFIEHALTRDLDRKAAPSREKPKPSIRAWRAPMTATDTRYPIERVFKPKEKTMPQLTVAARAIKVVVPLDAAAVATLPAPDGLARSKLAVACDGKIYTADIATKSLRKVKATIAAKRRRKCIRHGAGKVEGQRNYRSRHRRAGEARDERRGDEAVTAIEIQSLRALRARSA
jgi:hypothetical protein